MFGVLCLRRISVFSYLFWASSFVYVPFSQVSDTEREDFVTCSAAVHKFGVSQVPRPSIDTCKSATIG